ncbi:hypothetical protein [Streptomyces synnematoformans]|uniref:Lipoprotein n=1 Tax=Streptomyces synnematoformans TaxID=415721 RepID=A0ABN2XB24_9ACTN
MRRLTTLTAAAVAVLLLFGAAACTDDKDAQEREADARQKGYEDLVARQPGKTMGFSPTRETINFWIETWDKPKKLSYVYIQNANGDYGYMVLEGLPTSYCATQKPSYEIRSRHDSPVVVPAPATDGAYYSGGQCNAYYGKDATTGAYLEFTVGANQSYFLFDRPMELPEYQDAAPLGPTAIDDVPASKRAGR